MNIPRYNILSVLSYVNLKPNNTNFLWEANVTDKENPRPTRRVELYPKVYTGIKVSSKPKTIF